MPQALALAPCPTYGGWSSANKETKPQTVPNRPWCLAATGFGGPPSMQTAGAFWCVLVRS